MAWAVELSEEADRELGKLDAQHRKRILKFLYQRVARVDNPHSIGQALRRTGTQMGTHVWCPRRGTIYVEFAIWLAVTARLSQ